MCLYTKDKTVKVAQEDITGYKVLASDNTSLHYGFPYNPNSVYRHPANLSPATMPTAAHIIGRGIYSFRVDEGFHVFKNRNAVRLWAHPDDKVGAKSIEVTIPKGASYIEGIDGNGFACYVSTEIRTGDLTRLPSNPKEE